VPIDLEDTSHGVRIAIIHASRCGETPTSCAGRQHGVCRARRCDALQVKIGRSSVLQSQLPGIISSRCRWHRGRSYHAGFTYFELERGGEL
jgi:hypothetical protein